MWNVKIGGPGDFASNMLTYAEEDVVEHPESNELSRKVRYLKSVPAVIMQPDGWLSQADESSHFTSVPSGTLSGKIYTAEDPDGSKWAVSPPLEMPTFGGDPAVYTDVPTYVAYPNQSLLENPWFMVTKPSQTLFAYQPFRVELDFYQPPSTSDNHHTIISWGERGSDFGFEISLSADGYIYIGEVHKNKPTRLISTVKSSKEIKVTDRVWFEVWPIGSTGKAVIASNIMEEEVVITSFYSDYPVPNDCEITFTRTHGGAAAVRVIHPIFRYNMGGPYQDARRIITRWKWWPWSSATPDLSYVVIEPSGTSIVGAVEDKTFPFYGKDYTGYRVNIQFQTSSNTITTSWLLYMRMEFHDDDLPYPGTAEDISCYVTEIQKSCSMNEGAMVTIRCRDRDIETYYSPGAGTTKRGKLFNILHNKINQRIDIRDQNGRWFFRGYVNSIRDQGLDSANIFKEYTIECSDRAKILDMFVNYMRREDYNVVPGVTAKDVFEDVLERSGLDASILDYRLRVDDDPGTDIQLGLAIKKSDRISWSVRQSASEFIENFIQGLAGEYIFWRFDPNGNFVVGKIPCTTDDTSSVTSDYTFYVDFEDGCANGQWIRDINDAIQDDKEFANIVFVMGKNPSGVPPYISVVWSNPNSIFDINDPLYVGGPRIRGYDERRVTDIETLTGLCALAAQRWGHSLPRKLEITSAYNPVILPGDMVAIDGKLDYNYDEKSYWIVDSIEILVNRTSPISYFDAYNYYGADYTSPGNKFEAVATYNLIPAWDRVNPVL